MHVKLRRYISGNMLILLLFFTTESIAARMNIEVLPKVPYRRHADKKNPNKSQKVEYFFTLVNTVMYDS